MPPTAGDRLGSYEIVGPLGAGGMGEVYVARDTRLGREVAIKILPGALVEDPDRLARFEREAQAVSALNHPHIVTLYGVGTSEWGPYLVLERIDGVSLRTLLASGVPPLKRLLTYAAQIADGLAKAHAAGIVHRDLKPDNVMVTSDGFVKIVDFGLAKLVWPNFDARPDGETTTLAGRTESGMVLGTPGYLSPEQAAGKPADFRADQFAFGALLYEMATKVRPFQRGTFLESLAATIHDEPPPLSSKRPDAPPPLVWMVDRCLSKDPADRYASTQDLARDVADLRDRLTEISQRPGVSIGRAYSRRERRLAWVGGGALATALLLAAGVLIARPPPAGQPSYRRLTFQRGVVTGARFSPDGKTVYYSSAIGSNPSTVFMTRLDALASDPLKLPPGMLLSVSGKGELAILLTSQRNRSHSVGVLATAPALGGTPRPLLEDVADADWLPDGNRLAVSHYDGRLEFPAGHELAARGFMPRVSPNGEFIAFLTYASSGNTIEVDDAQGHRRLSRPLGFPYGLAWTSDSHEVWYTGSDSPGGDDRALYALSLSGEQRLIARAPGAISILDLASDGASALIETGSGWVNMTLLSTTGNREQTLDLYGRTDFSALSDDGRWVLAHENRDPGRGLYLLSADGTQRVTLGDGRPLGISPDGTIALISRLDRPSSLVLLPTGAGRAREIAPPASFDPVPTSLAHWSLDRRALFVAFQRAGGGTESTRIFAREGEQPWRPITPDGVDINFAVSPDGRAIAVRAGGGPVTLYSVAGGAPRPLPGESGVPLLWSSDGGSLFIQGPELFPARIRRHNIATGRNQPWRDVAPTNLTAFVYMFGVRLVQDGELCLFHVNRLETDLYLATGLR